MCVPECGGYLTGPAGSFSYPNTPGHDQYDHQVSCAWVIHTDANKVSYSLSYLKKEIKERVKENLLPFA